MTYDTGTVCRCILEAGGSAWWAADDCGEKRSVGLIYFRQTGARTDRLPPTPRHFGASKYGTSTNRQSAPSLSSRSREVQTCIYANWPACQGPDWSFISVMGARVFTIYCFNQASYYSGRSREVEFRFEWLLVVNYCSFWMIIRFSSE